MFSHYKINEQLIEVDRTLEAAEFSAFVHYVNEKNITSLFLNLKWDFCASQKDFILQLFSILALIQCKIDHVILLTPLKTLYPWLLNIVNDFPQIKNLELRCFVDANVISRFVETNATLEKLAIIGGDLQDDGAHLFAQALVKNKSLNHIDLTNNKIKCSGAEAILKAAVNQGQIQFISFYGNQMNNADVEALCKMTVNKTMKLDFSRCGHWDKKEEWCYSSNLKQYVLYFKSNPTLLKQLNPNSEPVQEQELANQLSVV